MKELLVSVRCDKHSHRRFDNIHVLHPPPSLGKEVLHSVLQRQAEDELESNGPGLQQTLK